MTSVKYKVLVFGVIAASVLAMSTNVYAATPTLSLSNVGGDTVQVNVSGDSNASVSLYYNVGNSSGMQVTTLGTTSASGYFSATVSASSHGIIAGNSVYVIVNGQQSSMQPWPSPTGTPSLSQSNITIGLGQSMTVYSQGNSAPVYMSGNTNASVASAQTNGSQQITVTGNQIGSTTATICYVGTASNCASLNITVQTGSVLSFGQNNVTVAVGQNITTTVSGGNGSCSITGNSNPSAVSAVLSGNVITLSGIAVGSTNVTVCDGSGNCATLYATAGSSTGSGSLYFSTSNPSITIGQIIVVTISGGSGYYVTGNSNTNVASQSINGNALTISGLQNGATTITVCSTSNGCSPIYVTVGSTNTGQVTFGVTNPTLAKGQSTNISLSGGSSYYISSYPNTNIVQASVSGGTLALYGVNAGSASLTVCASSGGCNTLYTTVTGGQSVSTQNASQSALLAAIQSMQSQLAQIVTQIQSMATTLTQLASNVTNSTVTTNTGTSGTNTTTFNFTKFLNVGSQGSEVTALQQYLSQKGFYSGSITGYFGELTRSAVMKFQDARGIAAVGYVGPSTRALLNAGK